MGEPPPTGVQVAALLSATVAVASGALESTAAAVTNASGDASPFESSFESSDGAGAPSSVVGVWRVSLERREARRSTCSPCSFHR